MSFLAISNRLMLRSMRFGVYRELTIGPGDLLKGRFLQLRAASSLCCKTRRIRGSSLHTASCCEKAKVLKDPSKQSTLTLEMLTFMHGRMNRQGKCFD